MRLKRDTTSLLTRQALIERARAAALNAYAPYSKFRVGAVVVGQNGMYTGANVENASFGLTLCAERSALSAAIAAGERQIHAVAMSCIDAAPGGAIGHLMPCGACRQWLAELAPHASIHIDGFDNVKTASSLLPDPFILQNEP